MKNMIKLLIPVLLLSWNHLQCQNAIATSTFEIAPGKFIVMYDSTDAAGVILDDPYDHYFQRIRRSEMSIQMKTPLESIADSVDLRAAFGKYIQKDMASFTESEHTLMKRIMEEIGNTVQNFNPDILPDTMVLIKTSARHFGEGVYYTRSNTVIIPYDALNPVYEKACKSTMYHELFHVYSRLNPEKRKELYKLIGFEKLEYDSLIIPEELDKRVLHNPDGVDFAQVINLKLDEENTIQAIPILYSNEYGFQSGKNVFFSYVGFSLYQIESDDQGNWTVLCGDDGYSSTLDMRKLPDFFRQIRSNTQYIIHPDEVLADNFTYVMEYQTNKDRYEKFDEEGRELLHLVEGILRD